MAGLIELAVAVVIGAVVGIGIVLLFFPRPQKPTIIYMTVPQITEPDVGSGSGCSVLLTMLLVAVLLAALVFVAAVFFW